MKVIVLISVITLGVINVNSQTFNFHRTSDPIVIYTDTSGYESEGVVNNFTNDTVPLRLIRTSVNLPHGWETCICDIVQCHPTGVDTAIAGYPPGLSSIYVIVYPLAGSYGTGFVTIRAERISNSSENYYATFGWSYSPIGIHPISNEVPNQFSLSQNYPNPFNPNSKIKMQIAKLSEVKLVVFDILGREVETLVNEQLNAGNYEIDFNGTNYSGGMYFYKLITGDFVETRKMVLMK